MHGRTELEARQLCHAVAHAVGVVSDEKAELGTVVELAEGANGATLAVVAVDVSGTAPNSEVVALAREESPLPLLQASELAASLVERSVNDVAEGHHALAIGLRRRASMVHGGASHGKESAEQAFGSAVELLGVGWRRNVRDSMLSVDSVDRT